MEENRPTRRRWFQFSLRTFLVAIMLVGCVGAWVGTLLEQKRRHERVVIEIFELGGRVDVADAGKFQHGKNGYSEFMPYIKLT